MSVTLLPFSPATQQPIDRYTALVFPVQLTGKSEQYTPTRYSWEEQEINPEDGSYRRVEGGREGTYEDAWAVELNNADVDTAAEQIVWLRFRGVETTGRVIYEFSSPPTDSQLYPRVVMAMITSDLPLTEVQPSGFPPATYPAYSYPARTGRWDDGRYYPPNNAPVIVFSDPGYVFSGREPVDWYLYNDKYPPSNSNPHPKTIAVIYLGTKPASGMWVLCQYQDTLTNGVHVYHASQEQTFGLLARPSTYAAGTPATAVTDVRTLGIASPLVIYPGDGVVSRATLGIQPATVTEPGVIKGRYTTTGGISSQVFGGDKNFTGTTTFENLVHVTYGAGYTGTIAISASLSLVVRQGIIYDAVIS